MKVLEARMRKQKAYIKLLQRVLGEKTTKIVGLFFKDDLCAQLNRSVELKSPIIKQAMVVAKTKLDGHQGLTHL